MALTWPILLLDFIMHLPFEPIKFFFFLNETRQDKAHLLMILMKHGQHAVSVTLFHIVHRDIMVEDHKQEQGHPQAIGKNSQLHVRDHSSI